MPARTSRPPTGTMPSSTASLPIPTRRTWCSRSSTAAWWSRGRSAGTRRSATSEPSAGESLREEPGAMSAQGSDALFERAQRVIPGGVNSPVRAFRGVGGRPFFVARAEGCRITDVDGRTYIDFLGSWGPLILGHAAPMVVEAVGEALARGTSYGAPTAAEVDMAEMISRVVPSMEMARLCSPAPAGGWWALRVAGGGPG